MRKLTLMLGAMLLAAAPALAAEPAMGAAEQPVPPVTTAAPASPEPAQGVGGPAQDAAMIAPTSESAKPKAAPKKKMAKKASSKVHKASTRKPAPQQPEAEAVPAPMQQQPQPYTGTFKHTPGSTNATPIPGVMMEAPASPTAQ